MLRLTPFGVLAVLLLASAPVRADDAEDKAVKFVEKLGGQVFRDNKQPGKPVVHVGLAGAKITAAEMKELAAFKNLATLAMPGATVASGGFKELAPLKNLTKLILYGSPVADEGLKEIATLTSLTELDLRDTKVTDAAMKELAALKGLQDLGYRNLPFDDLVAMRIHRCSISIM
jgi:hypothetical protein